MLPFKKECNYGSKKFIFQHDGCGPHRVKKVSAFLDENGAKVLSWSAQSPDLDPIAHVYSIMKRRLRLLLNYPTTRERLFKHLCTI